MPLGMRDPALSKAFSCKTIACGYRYTPQESPARVRPSQPSAAAGPGNIRIWRLGAPRGHGQSLNISQRKGHQTVGEGHIFACRERGRKRQGYAGDAVLAFYVSVVPGERDSGLYRRGRYEPLRSGSAVGPHHLYRTAHRASIACGR